MTDPVFHIARRAEWDAAQGPGEYRVSTLGRTLEEVGFIHCSTRGQVDGVANAFYRGETDLVVLVIDPDRLGVPLRLEDVGDQQFPHLFGPLRADAVTEVVPFTAGADGTFAFHWS